MSDLDRLGFAGDPATSPPLYRPGTVVTYRPDPSRHDPMWCREGMAVADDHGHLVDTYWLSSSYGGTYGTCGQDDHIVTTAEAESGRLLFHLDDYDELAQNNLNNRWEDYAPEDRQRITYQHGLQQRVYVRKGATPDHATKVANAREALLEAERHAAAAARGVEWRRQELAELEAQEATR